MTDPYPPGGRPETPHGGQAPGAGHSTDRTQSLPGTPASGAPDPSGSPATGPSSGPPAAGSPTSAPPALGGPSPAPPATGDTSSAPPAAGGDGRTAGWPATASTPPPAPTQPGPGFTADQPDATSGSRQPGTGFGAGQPGSYPGVAPGGHPEPPARPGGYPGQSGQPAGYSAEPSVAGYPGGYAGGPEPSAPAGHGGQPEPSPAGYPGQPEAPAGYAAQPEASSVGLSGPPASGPGGHAGPGGDQAGQPGGAYGNQPGGDQAGQPGGTGPQQWPSMGGEQPASGWPAPSPWSATPAAPGGPGGWAPASPQRPGRTATVALVLACVLVAVAAVQTVLLVRSNLALDDQKKAQSAAQARDEKRLKALEGTVKALEAHSLDAASVAKKVLPSVFQVVAGDYSGSSFVIGAAPGGGSYLLTNDHVVQPLLDSGSKTVRLERDGGTFSATVVQHDEDLDIAVLQSDQKFDKLNRVAKPVEPGEPVIVVGSPLGLNDSVTTGVVSSAQRDVPGSSGKFIQFDAAINPGNSGGPVMNAKGEVVGIATEKARDAEGIGLAIPISVPCDKFSVCGS